MERDLAGQRGEEKEERGGGGGSEREREAEIRSLSDHEGVDDVGDARDLAVVVPDRY